FIHDLAIVLLISLPFFVFFRFGGMPRAKGLFRAKVSNIDNQYYSSHPISIAIGHATTKENEQVEDMLKRADHHMYQKKKSYYQEILLP
ncbi:hypothetical protein ACF0C2_06480, partial [Acinetobacter baumannii]